MCQTNLSHAQIGLPQKFNSNSLMRISRPTFSYKSFLPPTPPPWEKLKRGITVLYNFYGTHAQHVEISAQYLSLKLLVLVTLIIHSFGQVLIQYLHSLQV